MMSKMLKTIESAEIVDSSVSVSRSLQDKAKKDESGGKAKKQNIEKGKTEDKKDDTKSSTATFDPVKQVYLKVIKEGDIDLSTSTVLLGEKGLDTEVINKGASFKPETLASIKAVMKLGGGKEALKEALKKKETPKGAFGTDVSKLSAQKDKKMGEGVWKIVTLIFLAVLSC